MESLKTIIQESPLQGFTELQDLIKYGRLTHIGKDFPINQKSWIEARVYSDDNRKQPLAVCKTAHEIELALLEYPFNGKTAEGDGEAIWEYRVFTPGQSSDGKGVNVWCAFWHNRGFRIKEI